MPWALIGGAIASGVSSLVGAKVASNAAKSAAKTQSQATDRALAVNQQVYNQQRQDQNPYMQVGQQGLTNLSQIVGNQQPRFGGGLNPSQPQMQPPMNLGTTGRPPMPQGGPQIPQGAPMGGGGQSGPMVTVQAPTGETRQVPQALAQQMVAKGARIVG